MYKAVIALLAGSSAATAIPDFFPRSPSSSAAKACSQLKATFPSNYVDSSSSNYQAEVELNWSTNCELPAACFFTPTSTDMVAKGLSIVTKAGSQFAIRNGGHNPNVKFASVDGSGVLFDMGQMKSLTLSSDNSIIHAGTGNKGGDVQKIADSVGKSGVTGLNTGVGISGLTLGGGYTLFSQLNGLVTDNIANFEVVLGDSSIVNANATSNTDLYRALRGGGNNFGIVTRFDMRTSPVHNIWYTLFTLDPKDYAKFMPALAQVQANMEKDPKANVYMLAAKNEVEVALFYAEPASAKPDAFAPLLNITPLETPVPPTNGTVYKLAQIMSPPENSVVRQIDSVITKPNADYYVALFKQILEQAPTSGSETDLVLAIKPMGSRVPSVGTAKAGGVPNSLNMPPISQTWTSILVQYKDNKDKDMMTQIQKNMDTWMTANARKANLLLPNLFANDAGAHQNVMASYGSESLDNLKAVSRKYDTAQVFQKLQANGFLVSKA
ncbi:FAD-binding domain-containing protein [Cucurbitaria berberidis CBS 394.84]|uniref:FAD-binding domain-containing protein n=1 Tax=Cucurbitaria berberidis CBS 394.84 TaxID=1168544 RepID=A0A9P4GQQ3_9PLEO|nr:FAD-binding domain-containing protein [Cucurbitaria berberidis CBS 394.84]KAF1849794.1 FAD-binding domain-containing protein [Cucurbitaria berberidis CBS 394.84]